MRLLPPVVERELRGLSRSRRLYWGRFFASLVAVSVVAWFWFTFRPGLGGSAGKQIFGGLATLTFIYCLISGAFLTADSVSEEKREGTLGLLFLTNLKAHDIAFGKLAANSLQAIYSLLGVFPVLAIPILLGGLVGEEIARVALVLLDALLFSLAVGLLVSTASEHDRKAQVGAFGVVLLITGGIPALVAFLNHQYRAGLPEICLAASPGYALACAFDQSYTAKPGAYWVSVGAVHLLTWMAFIGAALVLRRVWQDRPEQSSVKNWRGAWRRWKRGSERVRRLYRTGLLKINAYYWLSARDRLKPYYVIWFLGGCTGGWLLLWFYNRRDMLEQEAFLATSLLVQTGLKVWLAGESGRQFFEDRKSSALELTLSTPLPVRDILEGQFLALFRQFGPAVGLMLIFDLVGIVATARMRIGSDSEWLLGWAAAIIVFLADLATLSALGMWLGLTARRYTRAVARSLFQVVVLPWLIFFGVFTYMAVARLPALNSLPFVIGVYLVISLVTDLVLFLNASGNLTSRFREAAIQR